MSRLCVLPWRQVPLPAVEVDAKPVQGWGGVLDVQHTPCTCRANKRQVETHNSGVGLDIRMRIHKLNGA
jgi:hypothetical protein